MEEYEKLYDQFTKDNDDEIVLDYYNKVQENVNELNSRILRTGLYMLITIVFFFVFLDSKSIALETGYFTLADKGIIYKLIPLVFSYFMLMAIMLSNKVSRMKRCMIALSKHLYKQDASMKKKPDIQNFFIRNIIPFSFEDEVIEYILDSGNSMLVRILGYTPIVCMFLIPIGFEIIAIATAIKNYNPDWLTYISLVCSLCFILLSLLMAFSDFFAKNN